jgi:hypothetical protein
MFDFHSRRRRQGRAGINALARAARAAVEALESRTLLTVDLVGYAGPYLPVPGVEGGPPDGSGVINYQLRRGGSDLSASLTVNVSVVGVGDHPATAGEDFQAPTTATFAAHDEYAYIQISVTDDDLPEPAESLLLTVAPGEGYDVDPSAASEPGEPAMIEENDVPRVWAEADTSIAPDGATATEGGDTAMFLIKRDSTHGSLTVRYELGGDWGPDGASASPDDYTVPGVPADENGVREVTLADGEASAAVEVQAVDDELVEPYLEGFQLFIDGPAAGYDAVAGDDKYDNSGWPNGEHSPFAYGVIQDNDYDVSVSAADSAIEGQDGVAGFTISRYGDLRQPLTVNFSMEGTASADDDYDSEPFDAGQVTFGAGEQNAWLALTPTDDETAEWTEDVVLRLSESSAYQISGDAFATDQIVDDDPVDVIIQNLPEETEPSPNETDPGAFLAVNDDDDNNNGTPDNEESQADLSDDDLEPVELQMPQDAKEGATLTLSLNAYSTSSFRVWKADGTQLLGVFGGAGDPVTSVPLDAGDGPTMTVYLEALAAGSLNLTLQASDAPAATRPSNSSDAITAYADTYDLDLTMVNHNEPVGIIDDRFEVDDGGFVPMNNDDDDYTALATSYGEDQNQTGAIAGEDDLLPILIHGVQNRNGKMKLVYDGGLKVYRNGTDRTDPLGNGVEIPVQQQDLTLYVEGVSAGAHNIELWVDGKKRDTVKVTVFQWVGPLNVPAGGTYEYKVQSTPYAGAHWLSPSGGFLLPRDGNPSDVDVAWLGGAPNIGRAIYQVTDNYTWDLEVNVVVMTVAAPDSGAAFTAGRSETIPTKLTIWGTRSRSPNLLAPEYSGRPRLVSLDRHSTARQTAGCGRCGRDSCRI